MKDFARALQQAWRHWPLLTLALLCSLAVAALWGANIAALFPIIETTLHGQSLQEWNQKRMDAAQANVAKHESELKDLEQKLAASKDPAAQRELAFNVQMAKHQIKVDKASVYSTQRLQPYFERYMPSKPF